MTDIHFGSKIKSIIERSGDTKVEAANRLGYSKNNLFEIFKKEDVGTDVLKKVAQVYRVDIGYFFSGGYNLNQTGTINAVGDSVVTYSAEGNSRIKLLEKENEGLRSEIKVLREQIETYKELVAVLKENRR